MFLNLKCLILEFDLLQVIFKNNSSLGYNGYIFTKENFAHERTYYITKQHVQKVTILRREWITSFHCCFLRKWQQNYYFSFELKRFYQQDCFETCVGKIVMQKVPPSSRLCSLQRRRRPIITLLVQHYKQFQGTLGQVSNVIPIS